MTPQSWLITGGAGYIGAHVADELLESGKDVLVFDSLYHGLRSRIEYLQKKHSKVIPLIDADIRDTSKIEEVLERYEIHGIIHTAAYKSVGESIEKPDAYYEVNHIATKKLLEVTSKHQIKNFIFSSTAAVYGAPDHSNPIKEDAPKNPISPYGASKLAAELEVEKFLAIPGNRGTSLRFFNVVGTSAPELIDNSVENLVPIVINKLKAGQSPVIYGDDYSTPDGTCVRDYVDVRDIARAHVAVTDFIGKLPLAINVGTSRGGSVRDVIKLVCAAAENSEVVATVKGRRIGDSAYLRADVSLIQSSLGFTSKYSLEESIGSLFLGS
jgi:UDP-glucose 4-epimerase